MSRRQKRQFRLATFGILPVLMMFLLTAMIFVGISQNNQANATDSTDWEIVRGYINSYYSGSQSGGVLNGEAGFRMGKIDLWNRLDSNGDIQPNAGTGEGTCLLYTSPSPRDRTRYRM